MNFIQNQLKIADELETLTGVNLNPRILGSLETILENPFRAFTTDCIDFVDTIQVNGTRVLANIDQSGEGDISNIYRVSSSNSEEVFLNEIARIIESLERQNIVSFTSQDQKNKFKSLLITLARHIGVVTPEFEFPKIEVRLSENFNLSNSYNAIPHVDYSDTDRRGIVCLAVIPSLENEKVDTTSPIFISRDHHYSLESYRREIQNNYDEHVSIIKKIGTINYLKRFFPKIDLVSGNDIIVPSIGTPVFFATGIDGSWHLRSVAHPEQERIARLLIRIGY
jgi:hypothetical protein